MKELLDHFSNLKEAQLSFEALGEEVFKFDYSQIEFAHLLPNQDSTKDYARNILMHRPLEVVLLYWPPGVESAIHFHEGFWGYVAVLDGVCENIEYQLHDGVMNEGVILQGHVGGIIPENDGIIHKIRNGSKTENLVTLHFYYPAIDSFGGMKIYDLDNGRIGTLSDQAKAASWQQSETCFDLIKNDAFEFKGEYHGGKSHAIAPRVPKPSCQIISSMLSEYYNEQAEKYDMFDLQHESRTKYTQRVNELIAQDIRVYYPQLEKKLAIACGTGRRELAIQGQTEKNYQITGVDISKEMCQIANQRGLKTIHSDWLEAELGETDQFDVATFLYAFGHITTKIKRLAVLKKIFKHLKPGGTFYFDTFNLEDTNEWGPNALAQFKTLKLDKAGYDPGDLFYKKVGGKASAFLHYFKENEIVELLNQAGFEEVAVTHVGYVKYSGKIFQEKDKGSLFIKARKGE